MNLLMSIHPEYVEKIIVGEKKIEFRKSIFKREVENIIIYSTSPQKRIVGYFKFSEYESGTPVKIWEKYASVGGISEKNYFNYFENNETAYGIIINDFIAFKEPKIPQEIFKKFYPPQSFMYVDDEIFNILNGEKL